MSQESIERYLSVADCGLSDATGTLTESYIYNCPLNCPIQINITLVDFTALYGSPSDYLWHWYLGQFRYVRKHGHPIITGNTLSITLPSTSSSTAEYLELWAEGEDGVNIIIGRCKIYYRQSVYYTAESSSSESQYLSTSSVSWSSSSSSSSSISSNSSSSSSI